MAISTVDLISIQIVTSTRLRKVQSRRKNAAKYDRTKKTPVYTVPPEILRTVYDMLDIPSRVSLSLTSKYFYAMSKKVDTGLTDLPSPVKMHPKCNRLPCVYTNHLSDRRILLLMLKKWMPHGTTLCWVCLKYTLTSKYKWKETNSVNLMGINRIRLDALDDLKVKKVRCHVGCLRNQSLWSWTRKRPGTFGGFEESSMLSAHFIPKNMGGFVEYDAGAEVL